MIPLENIRVDDYMVLPKLANECVDKPNDHGDSCENLGKEPLNNVPVVEVMLSNCRAGVMGTNFNIILSNNSIIYSTVDSEFELFRSLLPQIGFIS